jgi:hypothetical protein
MIEPPRPAAFRTGTVDRSPYRVPGAVQVDVDDLFPRLRAELLDGAIGPHAGVADDDVQAAKLRDAGVESRLQCLVVTHIGLIAVDPPV